MDDNSEIKSIVPVVNYGEKKIDLVNYRYSTTQFTHPHYYTVTHPHYYIVTHPHCNQITREFFSTFSVLYCQTS